MRNNLGSIISIIYVLIILLICFAPMLDYVDFSSLNNPWDYARITDVDYTAKVLDEPKKRWTHTCYRTLNF